MKVKVNDTVKVVSGNKIGRIGKVIRIYDFISCTAVVEFDDGLAKFPVEVLEKVEPQENQEAKNEIPEGAKRISKEVFDAAIDEVVNLENMFNNVGDYSMFDLVEVMSAKVVVDMLRENMFKDQDVVVMTEDQFVAALWTGCSPVSLSKSVDNKMTARKCMDISIPSIVRLRKIVAIIFDESDND
jgi:ribosomal protein L24